LISLRKAPHRRERVQCGRWSAAHHRRVPCAGHWVLPAAKSRRRPQAGGHSRREVPGGLCTHPEL